MSHVTHINASCHVYKWAMSHIWMSRVTQNNESCHTYEWVTSHVWMSRVTRMDESCHTYKWVVSYIQIQTCVADSNTERTARAMSHISMSHVTHMNKSHHTYTWVTLHISKSHFTHINTSACRRFRQQMSSWGHRPLLQKSPIKETIFLQKRPMTANEQLEPCHTYQWVMSHISMSHVTRMNKSDHTYTHVNESRSRYQGVVYV